MNPLLAWWMLFGVAQAALFEPWEPWFKIDNNKEKKNG